MTAIVVGGGFAGIAAAVRLAKLGHAVTLLEASDRLGGQLLPYELDGLTWPRGPQTLTMPATLRDLFAKSGRRLERVLDLQMLDVGRRHVFLGERDGPARAPVTTVDLAMGSRGAMQDSFDAGLGDGAGAAWNGWLDRLDPVWDVLRRRALDQPFAGRDDLTRADFKTLDPRRSLARAARRGLRDENLRAVALDRARLAGQAPRAVPAFLGVADAVERSFGRWRIDGGDAALLAALEQRLDERRVDVRTDTTVLDVRRDGVRATGVVLDRDVVAADVIVWAAPAPPPATATAAPSLPVLSSGHTMLLLATGAPVLPAETVLHHDPPVRVSRDHLRTDGRQAWTLEHGGDEDVLLTLARHGIDVRDAIEVRHDLSAVDLVRRPEGAAHGWQWSGWRTGLHRPGVGAPPLQGLWQVGVNAHPGPALELIAMGTAAATTAIGKA